MNDQFDYQSDLDAILAEFSDYSNTLRDDVQPETKTSSKAGTPREMPSAAVPPESKATQASAEYYVDMSMLTDYLQNRQKPPETRPQPPISKQTAAPKQSEKKIESFSPAFQPGGRNYKKPRWVRKTQLQSGSQQEKSPDRVFNDEDRRKAEALQQFAEEKRTRREEERSALWENHQEEERSRQELSEKRQRLESPMKTLIAVLFGLFSVLLMGWIAVNVHPDSGVSSANAVESRLQLSRGLDSYVNNAYVDVMDAYVSTFAAEVTVSAPKRIYTIPESALAAPAPNPACFGETTDIAEVQAVIDAAAELLDGQQTLWNPDLQFYPGTTIQYYRDDSILVLTWKEVYDERCCTMSEIKVAHGSQFRRRLSGDTYGSSIQVYASEMAKASNAIAAANADFYAFRPMGITVYQRQLFRADPGKLDTCFITAEGDMLFSRVGQFTDPTQIQQYVQDNDVLFSLSFGPVLVDNGELQVCESYPIGEIDSQYSRAGIGMLGDLHYLLMTVNHTDYRPRAKINEFGRYMYEKGCIKAYNLDGGQTSEIVMNGTPVNHIDFGAERTVSDIIYFATAIPESEWSGGKGAAS